MENQTPAVSMPRFPGKFVNQAEPIKALKRLKKKPLNDKAVSFAPVQLQVN